MKEQCCLLSGKSHILRNADCILGLEKQKHSDFEGRRLHFEMESQDKKFYKQNLEKQPCEGGEK